MANNFFDGQFQIWLFVPTGQKQFSDSSMLHHICFLRTDYSNLLFGSFSWKYAFCSKTGSY
jgi:hypothetical protein